MLNLNGLAAQRTMVATICLVGGIVIAPFRGMLRVSGGTKIAFIISRDGRCSH
jgi:hypothetical protein